VVYATRGVLSKLSMDMKDPQHHTPNTQPQAQCPDPKHQTPNTRHQTPNTKHQHNSQTLNTKHQYNAQTLNQTPTPTQVERGVRDARRALEALDGHEGPRSPPLPTLQGYNRQCRTVRRGGNYRGTSRIRNSPPPYDPRHSPTVGS